MYRRIPKGVPRRVPEGTLEGIAEKIQDFKEEFIHKFIKGALWLGLNCDQTPDADKYAKCEFFLRESRTPEMT